jgi:hypothetical protein
MGQMRDIGSEIRRCTEMIAISSEDPVIGVDTLWEIHFRRKLTKNRNVGNQTEG